jgi:phosphate transport system substrate-binding protein
MKLAWLLALAVTAASATAGAAETFLVQGSTTFNDRVMKPYQAAIEASSGHALTVVPNKSSLGIVALFEKRADFAMISGPLATEVAALRKSNPEFRYERLRTFEVSRTRMAFGVNPANPVRKVTVEAMRKVLFGEITNWRELGGPELPIRLVIVREGGGVQATVESQLLEGRKISAPDPIVVQISTQVLKVVEQEPSAIGLAQLGVLIRSGLPELKVDPPIEQVLSYVTLGEPTPAMRDVIDMTFDIVARPRD